MRENNIEHRGVINSISGNQIRVHIVQMAACAGCKARELCTSSESSDKYIDVYDSLPERWSVGENVNVCGSLSMGKAAVRYAFGFPVCIIVLSMIVAKVLWSMSDGWSLFIVFSVLAVYFLVIYLLRDRMARKFVMWLEKV